MAENTKIEWAHHTFNPWIGCTKVSPGCDHCYAEADFATRRKVVQWGPNQPRKRTAPSTWAQPLRWNRMAEAEGTRYRVFCASLADVFDNEVPQEWRKDLFNLILSTPSLDWLLLTKRIGNAQQMIESLLPSSMKALPPGHPLAWPWPNVWIGATITSQAEADRDIPKLLAVPAAKRFLSMEPLLAPVDLTNVSPPIAEGRKWHGIDVLTRANRELRGCIDWVIVGGESGPNARPMHPDWARSLRDQCQDAGVPFMFKQWGEWVPRGPESMGYPLVEGVHRIRLTDRGENGSSLSAKGGNDVWMQLSGKKAAGRLLDGCEWNEVPA